MATKTTSEIIFRTDGVYNLGSGGVETKIAAPIKVTAFATRDPDAPQETAFTVIEFVNRRDSWKRETVPASMFWTQGSELIKVLADRGYMWPASKADRDSIIAALSKEKPDKNIRVTLVSGWCDGTYVLPDESYGPNGPTKDLVIAHNPTVRLGAYRRSGTLDGWQKHVAKQCTLSTRARLAVASAFAAPNLACLGIPSFGFNFSGDTSRGKTLCLRMAASVAGLNKGLVIPTWDGTAAGFEQRALGHRDGIVLLDELGHLVDDQGKILRLVTFRLSANNQKARAGQYVAAHGLVEENTQVIALSSSEQRTAWLRKTPRSLP